MEVKANIYKFLTKTLCKLKRWPNLMAIIRKASCFDVLPAILDSGIQLPREVCIASVEKLLKSASNVNVDQFLTLFHELLMKSQTVDASLKIGYFRRVRQIASTSEYPRTESVWLCLTCLDAAMSMLNSSRQKAQEWYELANSFFQRLHADDKRVHESRVKRGHDAILQAGK